jgi:hypothetical protein
MKETTMEREKSRVLALSLEFVKETSRMELFIVCK